MIEFVAHFSTAEAALGYVILDGRGTVAANRIGAHMLPAGIYRVENGVLIAVEPIAAVPFPEVQTSL
jgi:hypothetical protein